MKRATVNLAGRDRLCAVAAEQGEAHPDRLPPVLRPSKLRCRALNNSANADRILSGPRHAAVFTKAADAPVGHGGDIRLRQEFCHVRPEPELALVIAFVSSSMTLLPGDVISMGAALGGAVSVTIEHIGTLTFNLRMLGTQETAT